jgi:hypothetical protein
MNGTSSFAVTMSLATVPSVLLRDSTFGFPEWLFSQGHNLALLQEPLH